MKLRIFHLLAGLLVVAPSCAQVPKVVPPPRVERVVLVHGFGKMAIASYRTPMDLVILPPTRSIWERADNLEFPVVLHPLMLSSNKVMADFERRLLE